MKLKYSPITTAIRSMVQTALLQTRADIDETINRFVDNEVTTLMSEIQERIRTNLAQKILALYPPISDPFTTEYVDKEEAPANDWAVHSVSVVPNAEKAEVKKLIIVGLHSARHQQIKKEFNGCFDLRLFTPDQFSAIKKAVSHGDEVMLLTSYCSHKHSDCIKAQGGKLQLLHGTGHSVLRDALIEKYAQSV